MLLQWEIQVFVSFSVIQLCQFYFSSDQVEPSTVKHAYEYTWKTCLSVWHLMDSHPSLTPLWRLVNRESEKKWCRSGDWSSCLPTGPEGSYEDASVALSDDRTRTFTVTLKELKLSDTAWYLCSAGKHQIAVHVEVTPRPTTSRLPLT